MLGSPFLCGGLTDAYFQSMDKTEHLLDDVKRTDIEKKSTGACLVQNTKDTISVPEERICFTLHRAAKITAGENSISFEICAGAKLVGVEVQN